MLRPRFMWMGLWAFVLLWLAPGSAAAFCDDWCVPQVVDANCEPIQDPLVPGEEARILVTCLQECKRPLRPITRRQPRADEIPTELRQLDCRYRRKVTFRRTEQVCGEGRVYTLEAPPAGRYALMQELVLRVGPTGPKVCPPPPPEVLAEQRRQAEARKRRISPLEAQRRRGEALLAEARRSEWDMVKEDFNVELSAGGLLDFTADHPNNRLVAGGELRVGLRHTRRFDRGGGGGGKGFSISSSPGMRWCMPVLMCGMLGMIFAPPSSFIGNDQGIDLVGRVGRSFEPGVDPVVGSLGLRPFLRVAAEDRLRSQSLVGAFVPEVGLNFARSDATAFYMRWHLYPIDVLIHPDLAISWDGPVLGLVVPFDGLPIAPTVGTGLSLTGILDPD